MSENYDVIVIFRIFGQFGKVRRPESAKFIFLLIVTFRLTKTENRTKTKSKTAKSLKQLSNYCLQ